MNDKRKKIKILWNDASVFGPKRKSISLSLMETVGIFEGDRDGCLIVKNPTTINKKTNKKHPEKNPTFYIIPKGMIIKIDYLE